MIKSINKKFIAVLLLILTLLSNIIPTINFAYNTNDLGSVLDIVCVGSVEYHLKSYGVPSRGYVKTSIAGYYDNGIFYPAYCLDRPLKGVGDNGLEYSVTITDILSDTETYNKIWRVVTASYPYKSIESLGVPDWTYAYQATKMAVYCVTGQSNLEDFYASEDDEIGQAIVSLIHRLVDYGENGSATYKTPLSNILASGNAVLTDDYYVQNYTLKSNIDIVSYDIATAGFPTGTKVTGTDGTEKSTFGVGETFQVRLPISSFNGNINGIIRGTVTSKSYAVFYGSSYNEELQDYALAADPIELTNCSTNLNIQTNTGKLQINKTDDETKNPIAGVTFQLTKTDGTVVANATTNENGIATFSGLYQGNYKLKEIATDDNYILNSTIFDVNVEYNKTTTKNITNARKKGSLKIYKVDKDNNQIALGNVKFDLFSEEFQKVIGTYTTNVDGEIKIDNLRVGNYKLIEKNTGKWYNLADDTTVEVKWNTTTENTIENELKKGQVKVIKVDKDNNAVKLEGVEFEVLDANNKVLEKITTDENGEALTSRYPLRDYSKLKIRESKTLESYVLSDEIKTVLLREDQIESITFQNEVKKGQIKVIKVDLDNNEVKLEGVIFDIKDEQGNVVDTITTDKNGEAITKKLPISHQYTVVEKSTLKEYVLTDETKTVTLKQDEIKNITFQNEKRKGQLKVIKVDKDNNEVLLEGVVFDILDEQNNIVDTIKTDSNGEAVTKLLPIDQKYTVIEKSTLKEYVLTEETQTVELKENEITSIKFENEKIKGYVEITKIDSKTNEILEGATFGIYNTEYKEVGKLTTDKTGKAISSLLPIGKYYLKELSTGSVYYLLNENTYEFEIVENHEIVPITIENDSVEIEVTVDKEGTVEIKPGEKVDYTFSNVGNASNIYLENFKWYDYIPTDYIRLESMTTGTWNQELDYDVYYKTNKSEDYILFKKNLSTNENYNLDFTTIELAEDEYITETCFDFGKVDTGFKESTAPTMQCKSLDSLQDGQYFTNTTKTVGVYYGITAESNSDWTTVVHVPEEKHEPVLPKTGE